MTSPTDPKINEMANNMKMEPISKEEAQKSNSGKPVVFKVYDEPVIVKAGIPIMVSDETKDIFKLSKEIFDR